VFLAAGNKHQLNPTRAIEGFVPYSMSLLLIAVEIRLTGDSPLDGMRLPTVCDKKSG
jgi:hypothetical protein